METETSKPKDTTDTNTDFNCGIGKCSPRSLQKHRNLVCFTICYCLIAFFLTSSAAFLSTQITSIEKQFGISSTTSGVLLTSTEIGYLATVIFTTHFCKRFHGPRVVGLTGAVFGILAMLKSILNFVKPVVLPQEPSQTNTTNPRLQFLCTDDNSGEAGVGIVGPASGNQEVNWAVMIFGIIMAVQGAFISARAPLVTMYIDDNINDRAKTSYFVGVITATATFGPAISLLLGGAFSRIPVDLKNTYATPSDPRWVGAWWLGFIILGLGIFVASIPVALFPRRIPGAPVRVPLAGRKLLSQVKDLPLSVWRTLIRPIFVLAQLARCIHLFAIMGQIAFSPKHLETQFNIPAYQANLMLGIANVLTTTVGTLMGGFLTGRLSMNKSKCAMFILISHSFGVVFTGLGIVFGCENTPVEGLDFIQPSNITSNIPCNCNTTGFLPSCGEDGITYSNPCVAGCQNETGNLYGDCSQLGGLSVTPGICDNGCKYLYPFLASLMLMSIMGTMGTIPHYILLLRSVEEQDKAMCVGLMDFAASLLATIPAPIVYGKIIDTTCKVMASSIGPGACSLYDIVEFRYKIFGMEVGLKVFALFLLGIVFFLCRIEERREEKELQSAKKGEVVISRDNE